MQDYRGNFDAGEDYNPWNMKVKERINFGFVVLMLKRKLK
jgi:hypothetical protein